MAEKTAAAASSTAPSSSSSCDWKYGVFLSFRGKDTRNNFTSHLYKALDQKGIETYMDDKKMRTGEEISPTLVTAIQRSRCSIIVLSENYASSKWCLEELVVILECKRTKSQRVVPIFYNVDPSHVRNQTESFGEALAKHEKNLKIKEGKVRKWREALTRVANLSGLHSLNKLEAQLIEEIVVDISKDLKCVPSKDTQLLVGVNSCIRELESLLCLESTDVLMVGIWGMGGIGKTTLARAIYEKISYKFEGCCFLANIADLRVRKGEDYLKKQLLSSILKDKNIDVTATSLKARLHSKKVLIVLDDVNHRSILKKLAGEPNWFGPQSRIIITTRDKHLLVAHGVNTVYEVQKLQDEKAIELFKHFAFRNDSPSGDVMELIDHVIAYAQGLPLALEVLGSSLCEKNKDEWVCALNKLKKSPNMEIQKVLQISFDELDEDQKNIFLDIAIFFHEFGKDFTIEILNGCNFSAISGIRNLIDKSLISVIDDKLHMHDLLVEMGEEIVRKTSPHELGKRSRLWMQQDIYDVLENLTGTEKVEGILLELSGLKEIRFTTAAFAKMTRLRVLAICAAQMQCEVHISDDFKFHYDELRCLIWDHYPLKLLPCDFKSKNLVCLYMFDSHLTQLWEGNKVFENLKYMHLSDSKYLTETPDFSRVTNLKVLMLDGCTQLCKIHPSLGDLDKLTWLSLENCTNLEHFPGIGQLVSLEVLILSGCSKLEKFPDISQHMPCLQELCLDGTAITELPSSIGYATKLEILDLRNCRKLRSLPTSICKLTLLRILPLPGCSDLGKCEVNSGNLDALPRTLDQLCNLQELELQNCRSLRALPVLPSSLRIINASNCKSLEDAGAYGQLASLETLILSGCSKLEKFPDISQHMPCLRKLCLDGTAITELPSSIGYATELVILDLKNCRKLRSLPSSICKLKLLRTLSLSGCLDLGKLPRTLVRLCSLQELKLQNCRSLPALPSLPSSLKLINASNCKSLEDISPQSVFLIFGGSIFGNCFKLTKFQSTMERDLESMAVHVNQEIWRSTFVRQFPKVQVPFSTIFPGSRIPDWFKYRSEGHKINIQVSPNWYSSNFLGFALSAVVAPGKESLTSGWSTFCNLGYRALNLNLNCIFSFVDGLTRQLEHTTIGSDHVWLTYVPSFLPLDIEKGSRIKFSFGTNTESCIVKRCGVCPVYIRSSSDEDYSYTNDGNPSETDLDDLHEWRLEDNTIGSSPEEVRSRGSVQENVNDSVLQDTIIRSLDDAEPRGIGYSCTNAHACGQEMLQMGPDPFIFQFSNAHYIPGGSVVDTLCEWILEDAMIRRSLHEILEDLQQSESQEIGCFLTDSRRWDQERFERQPNPSISNIEIRSWVFITIFSFLLLVRIFYWAPFQIPPLLDAPFWISPLVAAPFGTSTLVAAPFGISSVLLVPFEISTLLGSVVLLVFGLFSIVQ